ncbi:hypothetical protein [Streptomyces sp. NBC_00354]|uniref:hypothetical protein n=1 Tax=Streptomyces sp. NBC_00354 TaxID=2975723 RepID=UPI002E272D91|nr:hypothetical protein OG296_31275 [Streptomyces sp. NBC_01001]
MSDEQPPALQIIDVTPVPASEVKPEDVGTLSLRYVDGVPQLVISGGRFAPAALTIVDPSGTPVATYTAGPLPVMTSRVLDTQNGLYTADMTVVFDAVPRP